MRAGARFRLSMGYAIITLGGKQYRVSEGQRLLVDRVPQEEGETLAAPTLLVGGDGETQIAPAGITVTATVVKHVLGEKVRIGKYRAKSGYKRHNGYRSRLTQIEIASIGKPRAARSRKKVAAAAAETPPEEG